MGTGMEAIGVLGTTSSARGNAIPRKEPRLSPGGSSLRTRNTRNQNLRVYCGCTPKGGRHSRCNLPKAGLTSRREESAINNGLGQRSALSLINEGQIIAKSLGRQGIVAEHFATLDPCVAQAQKRDKFSAPLAGTCLLWSSSHVYPVLSFHLA